MIQMILRWVAGSPFINIMNKDGTLNRKRAIPGQDRFVARKNVVQQLEADGVLVKVGIISIQYRIAIAVKSLSNLCFQPSGSVKILADRALEFWINTIHQSLYPSAGRRFIATGWRN